MSLWRLVLGSGASVLLHGVSVTVLQRDPVAPPPKPPPTVVELTALPAPPEPEPPERAPEKPEPIPSPAQPPKLVTKTLSHKLDAPPRAEPAPSPVAAEAPVVLAGLTLSNEGVALAMGAGHMPARIREAPVPVPPSLQRQASEPQLTPASDLSRKPVPPRLDSALERYYPVSLRSQGIEGEALMRVVLGKDGRVLDSKTLSESHSGFASACGRALRDSRWEPPVDKQGRPARTAVNYRCRFKVNF